MKNGIKVFTLTHKTGKGERENFLKNILCRNFNFKQVNEYWQKCFALVHSFASV